MKSLKTLAIAAALLAGASSFAMAQSTMSQPNSGSNVEQNAAASGGPGTHVGAPKTGTADSNAKVLHNQNGYKADQR